MITATLSPPNAIVFLFDRDNDDVQIPEYVDDQLIASTTSCISVGTRAAVDGDVTISLYLQSMPSSLIGLAKAFSGVLHAPSRNLAVMTADARTILEIPVDAEMLEIEVWTDDATGPGRVAILARIPGTRNSGDTILN